MIHLPLPPEVPSATPEEDSQHERGASSQGPDPAWDQGWTQAFAKIIHNVVHSKNCATASGVYLCSQFGIQKRVSCWKFVETVDLGDDNTKYLSYISLTVLSSEGERAWDCLAAKDAVILRYGLTKKCWLVWWLQSFMNMTTSRKDHANMSRDYMGVVLNTGSQELFSSFCRPTRVMFFI